MKRLFLVGLAALLASACATVKPKPKPVPVKPTNMVELIKYEQKARQLLDATNRLQNTRQKLEDQRYRLAKICTDYADHVVCQPQTAAAYARKQFCADGTFTKHVDSVVKACHQGQCKQVDQAQQLTRMDYMMLIQKLPHSLVLFHKAKTNIDRKDREQLQRFIETLQAEKGYFIIVGRASKDGKWRQNVRLALDRAENTRKFIVDTLGVNEARVGFITYAHPKMYLTRLDAKRLAQRRMGTRQANRSALVFSYPCYKRVAQ